ncbi:hypothetical protein RhiirA5_428902 [Rhizophagus irregularis]|uniref:Uncharacterized protein n=1 Tax=Rhizophagus irregularis TaxID=588596 RepID=A0A2N0NJU7_9GLOM|nr:hypothetical protein RhiirA5_439148 [Rhizophagus irregularis]PKB94843.1 hypothetical protein RhiirA5_437931 [Rhizophagus irregularis]PKB99959.1 hypothetical protein RhiirA5_428902 [Rhizophagus irregularis]
MVHQISGESDEWIEQMDQIFGESDEQIKRIDHPTFTNICFSILWVLDLNELDFENRLTDLNELNFQSLRHQNWILKMPDLYEPDFERQN